MAELKLRVTLNEARKKYTEAEARLAKEKFDFSEKLRQNDFSLESFDSAIANITKLEEIQFEIKKQMRYLKITTRITSTRGTNGIA